MSACATHNTESLVDRGANGGIAGDDVRVISQDAHRSVNVRGIDNHEITSIPIVTCGGVVQSQHGPIIAIMNQYVYHPHQKSIHSSGQLEWFKQDVNDHSTKIPNGLQRIKTNDDYILPLQMRQGLPYLPLRPYTDDEWDTLPHIVLTSDDEWDPSVLDHVYDVSSTEWSNTLASHEANPQLNLFDEYGNYIHRTVCHT